MRFITTVVAAAILIVLLYLFVGWMVDGYFGGNIVPDRAVPDSWAAPDSWSEWRDIVVVFFGAMMVLWALVGVAVMVAILVLVITVRKLIKENVAPAVDSLRSSLDNVKGTTEFAGETVVGPIIRVYSVFRGVRSGVGAVSNLPNFIKRRKK